MSLNSLHFVLIFSVLLLVLSVLQFSRKKADHIFTQMQLVLLLVFSFYYIGTWDWRFCLCSTVYTVVVFTLGLVEERKKHRKLVMILGVIGSVLMLGYFKYTNFFLISFVGMFGGNVQTLKIILPLGISFYTFSGISYLIDVCKGKITAERNVLYFFLYMLFFGKITAGPIVRASSFLPQLKQYKGVQWQRFLVGIQIFVFGLFKKIVLADHLGVFVDDVFYAPTAYHSITVIFAIISYSLQIYFDFSGYSDMAIGVAKIVGFDFDANFNLPYIAQNMSEFWKRWHISLSSWLQEYLYIPLGGSRKGEMRTYLNLLVVMLVSGIWHGAGVTFIAWGGLHGVMSCLNRMFQKLRKQVILPRWQRILMTYIVVALLWVPFRADTMATAIDVWKGAITLHSGIVQPYTWSFFAIVCLIAGTVLAERKARLDNQEYVNGYYPVLDLSKFWNQVMFFSFIGLTVLLAYFGNTAFIYGKF